MKYEVDLRNRKTGNSEKTIFSTENHDEAYIYAENWNRKNIKNYDIDIDYIDGNEGLIAEVYEVEK